MSEVSFCAKTSNQLSERRMCLSMEASKTFPDNYIRGPPRENMSPNVSSYSWTAKRPTKQEHLTGRRNNFTERDMNLFVRINHWSSVNHPGPVYRSGDVWHDASWCFSTYKQTETIERWVHKVNPSIPSILRIFRPTTELFQFHCDR